MKDIVAPAQIYWKHSSNNNNNKKKMLQIVSSPSFKHLRFDFFNMRISTRFGIQLRKITIKSWIEATSLQPSIPMVGVEKMLRLPSLKLTKFAKNGWDQNTIPGCNPYFGGMFFFLFSPIFQGWKTHLRVPIDHVLVVVSLKEKPQPPRVNPLDLSGGGGHSDSSWWVKMIFVTKLKMNSFKILVWIIL